MSFRICAHCDDPEAYLALREGGAFKNLNRDPIYGDFGLSYYPKANADSADSSFIVCNSDKPLLLVQAATRDTCLDHYGFPIRLKFADALQPDARRKTLAIGVRRLKEIAEANDLSEFVVRDDSKPEGVLSAIGTEMYNNGGTPKVEMRAVVDLTIDDDVIHRSVRKSYTSLINKGRREFDLVFVNRENLDRQKFDEYQKFHLRIAGRVTRPQESWDAMWDTISRGKGELLLSYLNQEDLVGANLVADGSETSTYVSAVYDRTLFDMPLGHWPLYCSILRSKERGLKRFDLGNLPTSNDASKKERGIGDFKRGFATHIETSVAWHCRVMSD